MWVVESATSVGSPYVTVVGNGAFPENTVPPLVLTVDPDFHGTPRLNWEGTATSGEDYVPSNLDFSQTNINAFDYHRDDTVYEPDETITVRRWYYDIQFSEDILITIQENDAPTLDSIPDFAGVVGEAIDPVFVTVGNFADGVDVPIDIAVDNATLFPTGSLVLLGTESFRLLTMTPTAGQLGTATITITAGHGNATVVESFVIDIQAARGIHTIAPIADQVIEEDGASAAIPISLIGFDPDQVTVRSRSQRTRRIQY